MGFKDSKQLQWAAIEEDEHCASSSINDSISSAAPLDLADDASSSSRGPLYELADLMAQLPIKRGLSKFYNGKSQTFASLSNVESVEDLGKKEMMSFSRRMKSCKSFGGNLNIHQKLGPKPTIAKRSPKTCLSSFPTKTTLFT
ncbi:oxidative stress 3 [Perilla frutescens var. frutescens]|nr:oxidative stress 3 [Perilla frutescens var. frutescens]